MLLGYLRYASGIITSWYYINRTRLSNWCSCQSAWLGIPRFWVRTRPFPTHIACLLNLPLAVWNKDKTKKWKERTLYRRSLQCGMYVARSLRCGINSWMKLIISRDWGADGTCAAEPLLMRATDSEVLWIGILTIFLWFCRYWYRRPEMTSSDRMPYGYWATRPVYNVLISLGRIASRKLLPHLATLGH